MLPHLPQLAQVPSSLHFMQKLVEGEAQEGGQLLALTLLKDKSMARLASNPTGHLLLGTIVALNPSTYALVAAIWISENFSTLVASPYFGKFSSTVLQLLLSNAENRDFASMLERCDCLLLPKYQIDNNLLKKVGGDSDLGSAPSPGGGLQQSPNARLAVQPFRSSWRGG